MPKQSQKALESQTAQREDSKRVTFDMLKEKSRVEEEVTIKLGDKELTMLFRAVGAKEWDRLISKNPPNTEQKSEGHSFNPDTFGPALLAATSVEPDLTVKQWSEIWNSDDWSRGEITDIYSEALKLANKGLDIPFTDND